MSLAISTTQFAVYLPVQNSALYPQGGSETFEDVAHERGLDVNDVRRFLRVAIARHVFKEPRIGSIAHTAASRLLVNNLMLEAWIINIAEEFWPSLSRVRVPLSLPCDMPTDCTLRW